MTKPSADQLKTRLIAGLILNAFIIGGEFVGGVLTQSMGLISDAMHNLIDQGSLFLTLYSHLLSQRPSTARSTFGYHRAGIVTALVNSVVLLAVSVGLVVVAVRRLLHPVPVAGRWIIYIAILGFVANMLIALLFRKGAEHDLNIRGAFWHMLGDAWVSLSVGVTGLVIYYTRWYILDPLITCIVVVAIVKGAWPILKESLEILMESTPRGLQTQDAIHIIESIPGVEKAHDVHLWTMRPGIFMLTCHVMVSREVPDPLSLLIPIRQRLIKELGMHHITLQIETSCCHPDVVHCDLEALAKAHVAAPALRVSALDHSH